MVMVMVISMIWTRICLTTSCNQGKHTDTVSYAAMLQDSRAEALFFFDKIPYARGNGGGGDHNVR